MRLKKNQKYCFEQRCDNIKGWMQSNQDGFLLSEQLAIMQELNSIFGNYAIQFSVSSHIDFYDSSYIRNVINLETSVFFDNNSLCSSITDSLHWPIAPSSVDAILLHHVVELSDFPHRILSEAAKAVRAGGKLLVVGFNPVSLLSVYRLMFPKVGQQFQGVHFIRANQMVDWLTLLGFKVEKLIFVNELKPFDFSNHTALFSQNIAKFLNQKSFFNGSYLLVATQLEHEIIPIRSVWRRIDQYLTRPVTSIKTHIKNN